MVLDLNEDILRDHFANVQHSVMGERSLIEKLLTVISQRELRLEREMLPMKMFNDEDLKPLCIDVVAYGALYDGFPMLDVVLTPNGLATVGNNTLSPASSARSEAARSSLADLLFRSQESLIRRLRKKREWLRSKWSSLFRRSLFVSLTDLCALKVDRTSDSLELAMAMQLKSAIVEDRIASRYVSPELMNHLRRECLADHLTHHERHVVDKILDAVRISVQSDEQTGDILIDVVQYMRSHPEAFHIWHKSRVASTFLDHSYKNDKKSGGYFF